eukprot:jgi/Mesvir1/6253/Mv11453-RA.1
MAVLGQSTVPGMQGKVPLLEVRSLVTLEAFRGQGIGSQILGHLVQKACAEYQAGGEPGHPLIFLTTIGRRKQFYERAGFEEQSFANIPAALRLEWLLGNGVARVALNERCLVMGLARPPVQA